MEGTRLALKRTLQYTLWSHCVGSLRRKPLLEPPIEQLQFAETIHTKSLQIPLFLTKASTGLYCMVTWLPLSCGLKGRKKKGKNFFQRRDDGYFKPTGKHDGTESMRTCHTYGNKVFINRSPSLRRRFLCFQSKTREHSHGIFSAKGWRGAW